MNTLVRAALTATLLVGSTTAAVVATDEVAPTAADGVGAVFVDGTDILYLESWPVQVVLAVEGSVPTPCHSVAWEVQDLGDRIDVLMWSVSDPEAICAQVLEPFEENVPLGSFEAADAPVTLNGDVVGQIELGEPDTGPTLAGAGWSFGFCVGHCMAELVIEGDALTLIGGDRDVQSPLYENRGELTSAGRQQLDAALAVVGDAELDSVYGCPDCADGGAAHLDIVRGGAVETVSMEFSNPPDILVDVYAISAAIISSLETCATTELVIVADDCLAYEA